MKSRDIALGAFGPVVDAIQADGTAADELFAVADLLRGQSPLRCPLSDPSANERDWQALACKFFEGRLRTAAPPVATEVAYRPWPSGQTMINAIEWQGVRGLLRTANERRELKRAQEELYRFALIVDGSPELSDALRNRGRALVDRRALITRLLAGRVTPVMERPTPCVVAIRAHTVPFTLTSYLVLTTNLARKRITRITAAHPLDGGRTERPRRTLGAQVGDPVLLQITVGENVINGTGVDPGTHVFELTAAGRFDEARRLPN